MFKIPVQNSIWEIDSPQIMGILNITADSFYANSRVNTVELALEIAEKFINEGAKIIDIGGQSTRPGATFISIKEEIDAVTPIIEALRLKFPNTYISIDTFNSEVALQSLQAGANIVNDISCGSFDERMLEVVATHRAGYIGMHITGSFETMHLVPSRENVILDLVSYFKEKKQILENFGIQQWIIDPGFGFGKTIQENFSIVKELGQLKEIGLPILLGASRKSSIYKTLNITASEALNGTTVVNTVGLMNGANIIRVHDVKEAKEVIDIIQLLK
ncbi:MAG: dihydropteroate synthase [Bacteroidota bacterium]|jgi:dihydropteroate synthase